MANKGIRNALAIVLISVLFATLLLYMLLTGLAATAQINPEGGKSIVQEQQVNTIGVDELVDLMKSGKSYVLVDARPREAYDQGHLPGAMSIPISEIGSYVDRLDKDRIVVTYCDSFESPISTNAAMEFMRLGFKDVRDYKGGIKEWKEKDYPVYGR